MYAGHFAAGLALRTVEPRTPAWAVAIGVGLIDILFGIFVAVGMEHANATGTFDVPWSHSLLMVLIWAGLFALPFRRHGSRVMLVLALAVLSHWGLDAFVHQRDLGLWPGSALLVGGHDVFGGNGGVLEAVVTTGGCAVYLIRAARDEGYGRLALGSCGVVALCFALERFAG
jgi:hypothetical protein